MTRYSVIIPCHNEAGSIGPVLKSVMENVPDAEVIVVDDGSTDDTATVAARTPKVKVLRQKKNSGKGNALREGILAARGNRLVFIDGDGQDDPADLKLLIREAEAGHDFVNGSKFLGTIEAGGISAPNFLGNKFMSGLINLLFGSSITDSQSGFRIVSRKLIVPWKLESTQYEIETEMLCKALKSGARIKEVPVTRKARTSGATGFRRLRNGLRIVQTIIRERFARKPRSD